MTRAVFDTTVFIDAYSGQRGAAELLESGVRNELEAALSAVTVYELWLQDMSRDEEAFHTMATSIVRTIDFDSAMARLVAEWLKGAPRSQRLRFAADAMIAATAASFGATIYTRNPRDFARFYADVRGY